MVDLVSSVNYMTDFRYDYYFSRKKFLGIKLGATNVSLDEA